MDNALTDFFTQTDPAFLVSTIVVTLVTIFGLGYLFYHLNKPTDDKLIENAIKELTDEYMKDVIISDGMYGYYFVDYLLLLSGKILVLGVEHYQGYIFGGENIDEWAQVVNQKSYKFKNPLRSYVACAQNINDIFKGAEVEARIIFTSVGSFPKGVPKGVYQMKDYRTELGEIKTSNSTTPEMVEIWQQLKKMINEHMGQYHTEKLKEVTG